MPARSRRSGSKKKIKKIKKKKRKKKKCNRLRNRWRELQRQPNQTCTVDAENVKIVSKLARNFVHS